ncbi:MAG: undecaprenyl-diphosphate phosphatase [Pseudomonadota bacterium]
MPLIQLIILALVQGITEFLPISSSAHLVLVPFFTGWSDQGLLIDVAVHVGTLLAVIIYFWRDVAGMIWGVLSLLTGRRREGTRLAIFVIVASIPVVLAGAALHRFGPDLFRSVEIIAWTTIGFGLLLGLADRLYPSTARIDQMRLGGALLVGLAQCLALIPGTSRSGITMTAGRALGLQRSEAARFSMLLSIPAILGAGLLAGLDLADADDARLTGDAVIAGSLAFITALVAIAAMMAWLKRASFTPFVIYRVLLGLVLLYALYT